MLIDTHCHLDAGEFDDDRAQVWARARAAGVARVVIPAVARDNFAVVRGLAHEIDGGTYALGIHPLFVMQADDGDLARLREAVIAALPDPRFVAIGEIGLDFFVESIASGAPRARQEHFYQAQLKLAAEFDLPVLLHVRRSQDVLLKYLRRIDVPGGIAHAFNGSRQQADLFVQRGFALGLGGEMTYERSRNIRRLAEGMPLEALVLETDAPDIPPAWLQRENRRNAPFELPRMAQVLAQLRGLDEAGVAAATTANAMRVLPRLAGPSQAGNPAPAR
ncbi:putative deoxyribonuclease YjjV [Pigmentiphaga humi]|uniref:Putative deoxyribonuclease YjjV n=1 Tax=Pigmentiphaga humi TaxID=2478468 RepID=A0A3P4B7J1_9BURK|nr:TatD family hydrolase [Pigmentiphaga humi]VCU72274.1 putative deoxyribonuclease YjjV [Pigmentiphaga humi]